jgi:hypothetical protein
MHPRHPPLHQLRWLHHWMVATYHQMGWPPPASGECVRLPRPYTSAHLSLGDLRSPYP